MRLNILPYGRAPLQNTDCSPPSEGQDSTEQNTTRLRWYEQKKYRYEPPLYSERIVEDKPRYGQKLRKRKPDHLVIDTTPHPKSAASPQASHRSTTSQPNVVPQRIPKLQRSQKRLSVRSRVGLSSKSDEASQTRAQKQKRVIFPPGIGNMLDAVKGMGERAEEKMRKAKMKRDRKRARVAQKAKCASPDAFTSLMGRGAESKEGRMSVSQKKRPRIGVLSFLTDPLRKQHKKEESACSTSADIRAEDDDDPLTMYTPRVESFVELPLHPATLSRIPDAEQMTDSDDGSENPFRDPVGYGKSVLAWARGRRTAPSGGGKAKLQMFFGLGRPHQE